MPLTPAPNATKSSALSDEGATGHWYERLANGTTVPLYEEGGVFGIRRARALTKEGRCALPSATTLFKCLHKGYLDDVWKPQQIAKEVARLSEKLTPNELQGIIADRDAFAKLKGDAFTEVDATATYGTAVHKALEEWFRDGTVDREHHHIVKAVEAEFQEYGLEPIELEACVSNPKLGYAGMCDVVALDYHQNPCIIDFKTRKTKPGKTPGKYESDRMQIGAYGVAHFGEDMFLGEGRGFNIIISTTEPGRVVTVEHKQKDLVRFFEAFRGLCHHWQYIKNYYPNQPTTNV